MLRRTVPVLLALLATSSLASAQVIIITPPGERPMRLPRPFPPMPVRPTLPPAASYTIKSLDIAGTLADQMAKIEVSQTFRNTGSTQLEVSFIFPLPYDGAIDRMTFMVDGKEYPAQLMRGDEARRIYEEIVRRNRDPALLEWIGTGMFKTSVFPVPPGGERTVSLRYTQLCRKQSGATEFTLPLSTAKYTAEPPERVSIRLSIESGDVIKNIYSPTNAIEIKRPDERHAVVSYSLNHQTPTSDFRLFYDTGRGAVGMSLLSYRPSGGEDGYFLLLASPEIKAAGDARPRKTVLFVVDRSGSMQGEKIEQVKEALKYVLNNLREGDLFNIIAYDDAVTVFKPELQRYNDRTRRAALGFVQGIYAGGGTNIDAALTTAFGQLMDERQPAYVVFLTDGLPTVGLTNENQIVENAKSANRVRARLFDFGVGFDVNARLLDKLARVGFGQSEYVRPDENIEAHVSRLYRRIGAPALSRVTVAFGFDALPAELGEPVNRMYPKEVYDLFEGDQLVLVGRYRKSGPVKVTIKGHVGGQPKQFDFPATLSARSDEQSFAFIEKLWATRRIGEIIDELDLKGRNEELVKELVSLSTRHGILTPYTSFLADDRTDIRALTHNATRAGGSLRSLGYVSGDSGVAQRQVKAGFQAEVAAPVSGGAVYRDAMGIKKEARSIQNIGNKTFYCRENEWIDSTVSDEMSKHAVKLVQFSDEYFKLASENGRTLAQYLVFDEPTLVNVNGQCYRIEPAK